MILRRPFLASRPSIQVCLQCLRNSSTATRVAKRPVPPPTPFVPDVQTFLTLIGRQLSQHASKIPSWDALFRLSSTQLRDLGIDPPRARRYLLRWRERFRQGQYGIGGDLEHVKDGVGEIKIFEVPVPEEWKASNPSADMATANRSPGMRHVAINVPNGEEMPTKPLEECVPVKHVKAKGWNTIVGKNVYMINGEKAQIKVQEGLWEDRRGHKVDGGERRKAEVRFKRRAEEKKKTS
ncbi:uncharacterized protein PV09_06873 [Verruconis gallopava]|uniref:Small ribosomal subunit protein mS41 n=1 Tax=Verruconis gallopava TaxID=253628 RepID=A0A0D1YLI1_9PEZI|nr:uncharacterized protein PV09_06873 [Verruconis gallopava]KIW01692.1 hypothetical protein PV09_06873 [Verruconis gallopava]